jgi:hypothetical protein
LTKAYLGKFDITHRLAFFLHTSCIFALSMHPFADLDEYDHLQHQFLVATADILIREHWQHCHLVQMG